jgi:transcriptional regulator with XRE-family HTH domain
VKRGNSSKNTQQPESLSTEAGEPALANLPDRIKAALAGQKIEEIAKKIGVSSSALYNWLSGTNEPSLAKLFALAQITRTSPAWLIVGQGTPDSIPGYMRPLYKTKAPPFAFESQWLETNFNPGNFIAGHFLLLEVPDDSMEPTFKKGEFLLVRGYEEPSKMAHVNGIYAVSLKTAAEHPSLEDSVLIPKRVEWSSREDATLKCDNPAYPSVIRFNARPGRKKDIEIVGRVVWHGRLI